VADQQSRSRVVLTQVVGCRDEVFYVLDVNPNADISPDTSLAYALEAAGMGYGAFFSQIVHLASVRHSMRSAAREV